MSIRLFDFAVLSLKLNSKLYQLAGIVAIWISVKYHVDLKLEVFLHRFIRILGQYSIINVF